MPFVEIGHGAKAAGTILGSIDLGRLTNRESAAALLPNDPMHTGAFCS